MTKNKTGLSFLWLSAVAFILDLLTKYIVVQRFDLYESVNILPIFNLTYVRNYGAAFSFFSLSMMVGRNISLSCLRLGIFFNAGLLYEKRIRQSKKLQNSALMH